MSIAIVQPHFTSGNVSALAAAYWREVDADPSYAATTVGRRAASSRTERPRSRGLSDKTRLA